MTTDEAGKVIVARIIINSYIERQGLLRPGELILEANGERVKNPEQVGPVIVGYIRQNTIPYSRCQVLKRRKVFFNLDGCLFS